MKPLMSRRFVPFLVVSILAGVSLLAAEPARAAQALFRVQRTFLGAPFPAWSTDAQGNGTPYCVAAGDIADCGGAGRFINPLEPYKPFTFTQTSMGASMATGIGTACQNNSCKSGTSLPPGTALVSKQSNLPGQRFTLPRSFFNVTYSPTPSYPSTAFSGYLTKSYVKYANFEARFGPNNPNGATKQTTVTIHNAGGTDRYPIISTTAMGKQVYTNTHGGNFGFSRNGYLKIDPGPNRFGGTMKLLLHPDSLFYNYISKFAPTTFKGIGTFNYTRRGVDWTEGFESELGSLSSSGMVTRFVVASRGLVDTMTPTKPNGAPKYTNTYLFSTVTKTPYKGTAGTPYTYKFYRAPFSYTASGNKVSSLNYYLHLNAPWTTGKVSAFNDGGVTSNYGVHPVSKGYDRSLMGTQCPGGGAPKASGTCTLTRTYTGTEYFGAGNYKYFTQKYYSTLKGVTRVVSLVKPRLLHIYARPRIASDPFFSPFQNMRVWNMKVLFLPEPSVLLLLGSGIAGLGGLAVLRRR